MAVALELAWRAFSAFPGRLAHGAGRAARRCSALSTLSLAWLTPRSSYETLWEWQPGVVTAAVWLLTATALLVVFYQVPIGDWQRAIMLGLAPYLLVFVTLLSLLRRHGWAVRAEVGLARLAGLPRRSCCSGPGRPGARTTRAPAAWRAGSPPDARARALVGRLRGAVLHARPLQPRARAAALAVRAERAGAARARVAAPARSSSTRRSRARPSTPPSAPATRSRAPDALTVLRVALSVLEEAGADRLTRLRAMAVYSRMVQAIRPLPAAVRRPRSAAPGSRRAAPRSRARPRFLVGTQERFRLWLLLMGLGVRIVLRGGPARRRGAAASPRAAAVGDVRRRALPTSRRSTRRTSPRSRRSRRRSRPSTAAAGSGSGSASPATPASRSAERYAPPRSRGSAPRASRPAAARRAARSGAGAGARATSARPSASEPSRPQAIACSSRLPVAVASTGPASTGRPAASAVAWFR